VNGGFPRQSGGLSPTVHDSCASYVIRDSSRWDLTAFAVTKADRVLKPLDTQYSKEVLTAAESIRRVTALQKDAW
jgi:hypothetical protein